MLEYRYYCLSCQQDCEVLSVRQERFNIVVTEKVSICHAKKVGIRRDAQGNLLTKS